MKARGNAIRRWVVTLAMVAVACSGDGAPPVPAAETAAGTPTTRSPSESSAGAVGGSARAGTTTPGPVVTAACSGDGAVPWTAALTAEAVPLIDDGPVTVDAVVYPHPDYEGNPWSQWGQGIVVDDGRFLSAIGDHLGVDGNSYLYEYDPATRRLTLIADVQEVVAHEPGAWGYGKVHGQMVEGPCGVYVSSYWGSRRGLVFDDAYQGDHLMLVDPARRTVRDVSVILPEHGVPSLASSPDDGLIYAEVVDPASDPDTGWFVVLDGDGSEVFRSDVTHIGFRAAAVDANGRALFSGGDGALWVYDPALNEVTPLDAEMPGAWLRAATRPAPDGTIFGVTRQPDALFALSPDGTVRELGPVRGYTTSLAMDADGATVYYVPYAHGGSHVEGTPVVAVDTITGEESVVVTLNDAAEARLGLTLGGSYNVVMDHQADVLYIGMNAGEVGTGDVFGSVVLLIVSLSP